MTQTVAIEFTLEFLRECLASVGINPHQLALKMAELDGSDPNKYNGPVYQMTGGSLTYNPPLQKFCLALTALGLPVTPREALLHLRKVTLERADPITPQQLAQLMAMAEGSSPFRFTNTARLLLRADPEQYKPSLHAFSLALKLADQSRKVGSRDEHHPLYVQGYSEGFTRGYLLGVCNSKDQNINN